MKIAFKWGILAVICLVMVAKANATVTNASWTFPSATTPGPSQPMAADLSIYSTNNYLGWTLFNSSLNVGFVSNPGNTTAFEFSYNGNHSAYLNGSTLTLTSTISGLTAGTWLTNVQLSYDTLWNKTATSVTETWAYSINGGAFIDFDTLTVTGNIWQSQVSPLSGLTLYNGDTIAFRDTITGASGNNGNLDFDNIQLISSVVPEPSSFALVALGIGSILSTLVKPRRRCFVAHA
jgi:hypothetical protein